MNLRRISLLAILVGLGLPLAGRADEEMERHLADLRKQTEDPTLSPERRAQVVLEMAATLDRVAQAAPNAEERRSRWTDAITLIDRFQEQNPGHLQSRQLQFQASVYLWARARIWMQQAEASPTDREAQRRATENLDAAIARLRGLHAATRDDDDLLAQNTRFRLAQALADRAELDGKDREAREDREREALKALERPVSEPSLQGFTHLLRARILARLGDPRGADAALKAAAKSVPPPPGPELIEVRVDAAIAGEDYDAALRAIERAGPDVGAPQKGLLSVRVRLAELADPDRKADRGAVETALFAAAGPLRTSSAPEARLAMLALARGLNEPGKTRPPDDWETLAEANAALGDLARAGAIEAKGADRAERMGATDRAEGMRLRAGAFLYQAGQFLEVDRLLSKIADDPKAGASRPRAGLLRTLARGRALALRLPGASQSSYVAALEAQIRDFPGDPSTNEARWLLGKLRLATQGRDAALGLWNAIARDDPRWLEARLAVAALRQEDLDLQRINNDLPLIRARYGEARTFLNATLAQCRDDRERAAVELALARLELTPDAGHPDEARSLTETILRSASQAEQRDQARRLHIVASAEMNHFIEAEQEARAEVRTSRPAELLGLARLLDHVASESRSDLRMRRIGLILRVLLAPLQGDDVLDPAGRAEARLRQTRALLLSGDDDRARASVAAWSAAPPMTDDAILRDLADAFARLEGHRMAADVQRLRVQRAAAGSLPWFEARYGLALAYYRSGKEREARKLIDATAILHPDLGGGDLREKFVRLRQRLDPDQ